MLRHYRLRLGQAILGGGMPRMISFNIPSNNMETRTHRSHQHLNIIMMERL